MILAATGWGLLILVAIKKEELVRDYFDAICEIDELTKELNHLRDKSLLKALADHDFEAGC